VGATGIGEEFFPGDHFQDGLDFRLFEAVDFPRATEVEIDPVLSLMEYPGANHTDTEEGGKRSDDENHDGKGHE